MENDLTFADDLDEYVEHELHYDDLVLGQEYRILIKDLLTSKVIKRSQNQYYYIFNVKILKDIKDLNIYEGDEFKLHVSRKSFLKAFDIALRLVGFHRLQLNKKGTYHVEITLIRQSRYVLELKDLVFSKFSDKLR